MLEAALPLLLLLTVALQQLNGQCLQVPCPYINTASSRKIICSKPILLRCLSQAAGLTLGLQQGQDVTWCRGAMFPSLDTRRKSRVHGMRGGAACFMLRQAPPARHRVHNIAHSPSRTGPLTLRIIRRFWSSRNLTRTWVTCWRRHADGSVRQRSRAAAPRMHALHACLLNAPGRESRSSQ